jgi:hypothetical protein
MYIYCAGASARASLPRMKLCFHEAGSTGKLVRDCVSNWRKSLRLEVMLYQRCSPSVELVGELMMSQQCAVLSHRLLMAGCTVRRWSPNHTAASAAAVDNVFFTCSQNANDGTIVALLHWLYATNNFSQVQSEKIHTSLMYCPSVSSTEMFGFHNCLHSTLQPDTNKQENKK